MHTTPVPVNVQIFCVLYYFLFSFILDTNLCTSDLSRTYLGTIEHTGEIFFYYSSELKFNELVNVYFQRFQSTYYLHNTSHKHQ